MASAASTSSVADLARVQPRQIRPGDTVRTGESRFPQYRVIAISGERAWLRDIQYGNDSIVPVAGLVTIRS